MNELALFAGAGGGILASKLLGYRTVCAVERDAYAASILAQRQNDGALPPFPIWSDVTTFDGSPWRGAVDLVSGGFPCQDISAAGSGRGLDGERSGLWKEMARVIGEVEPAEVFVENSPLLSGRGLHVVLGDLAEMGFDAGWGVLGAWHFSAPHERDRMWIYAAHPDRAWKLQQEGSFEKKRRRIGNCSQQNGIRKALANTDCDHAQGLQQEITNSKKREKSRTRPLRPCSDGFRWWSTEPALGRVGDGVAHRMDRLRAIGNGQVPIVAEQAFRILKAKLLDEQLQNWLPW